MPRGTSRPPPRRGESDEGTPAYSSCRRPPQDLDPGRPSNIKGGDSGASGVTEATPRRTSALQIAQNRHKVGLDERRSSGGFEIAFARGPRQEQQGVPSHGLGDP